MGDIIKPVTQWISANIPWTILIGIFIISLFFEISKIKVSPLKWLWKLISFPFKKIDEQRTSSFKNIVVTFKSDMESKLNNMETVIDTKLTGVTDSFDNKLEEVATAQNSNCAAVKACFTELEKRFDKLDDKQQETDERLDMLAAARIKNHVLNFARQCRKGEPHSHEDFANLFKENKEYEVLVAKYKWDNDVYKHDYAYILRVYDEHNNRGDFLE
jgi:hypothetical protein